ncbi:predicted protein [Arabidopsis lyrata subsp. lyrata]|uniref:Predicted protein n=1 Tax=Arabidopsis lyrata subsp. lyrata TaxID=81972 RepID=D7LMM2_ARALL|nr:predicted protein [Arabidopsis lyrata subsp. lyrata]
MIHLKNAANVDAHLLLFKSNLYDFCHYSILSVQFCLIIMSKLMAFSLFGVDDNTRAPNHRYQIPKMRTWREHDGIAFGFNLLEKISSTIGAKDKDPFE